ncbi:MAG: hypothetical protein ACPGVB_17170, partial [Chitinophagales bacterium]
LSLFLFICLISTGFYACQQEGATKEAVNPMSSAEYNYLTTEYVKNVEGAMGNSLEKKEVYTKVVKSNFHGEDANYTFTAYDIHRKGEGAPIAIWVKLDIDRLYSTLGEHTRKQETKYLCIPSGKASDALHTKYNEEVEKLGFKDYEVYLSNLSRLLADLYL